jgi:AraC-like DNA-binding protein
MAASVAGAIMGRRGEYRADPDGEWEALNAAPIDGLADVVLGYTGYRETAAQPLSRLQTPETVAKVIFAFGAALTVASPGHEAVNMDGSFFVAFSTLPALTEFRGESMGIEVSLTPLGARCLLGQPLEEVSEPVMDLETLLGPRVGLLTERLAETRSWDERFELVDGFLLERMAAATEPPPMVEWAWRRLVASGGRASIAKLADGIGCSHEHLSRSFRRDIGLTPKAAAAVIRFNRAEELLRARLGQVGLSELAIACGYSDQSHLTREFRRFAGITPAARRDQFLTRRAAIGDIA